MVTVNEISNQYSHIMNKVLDRWRRWPSGGIEYNDYFKEKAPKKRAFYVATRFLSDIYYQNYRKRNITEKEFFELVILYFNQDIRWKMYGLEPANIRDYKGKTIVGKYFRLVEDTVMNHEVKKFTFDEIKEIERFYHYNEMLTGTLHIDPQYRTY